MDLNQLELKIIAEALSFLKDSAKTDIQEQTESFVLTNSISQTTIKDVSEDCLILESTSKVLIKVLDSLPDNDLKENMMYCAYHDIAQAAEFKRILKTTKDENSKRTESCN